MDKSQIIPQSEVISRIQSEIEVALDELENIFIPLLGHSEAKRLLIAATKYPMEVTDFSQEKNVALIRAYSCSKTVKDNLVALGVEVVITQMIKQQQDAQKAPADLELAPETLTTKPAPKKRAKKTT